MPEPIDLLKQIHKKDSERLKPIFERHGLKHGESPLLDLSREICLDGANTFASTFRAFAGDGWARKGVSWEEIVRDVGGKLKVKLPKDASVPELEQRVLAAVVEKYFESLSEEERAEVNDQLGQVANGVSVAEATKLLSTRGGAAALTVAFRKAILKASTEVLKKVLAQVAGKEAAKQATRYAGAVVPGLNILLGAWTVVDLAGPAYRKTIPTVIELALMRLELESEHV